MRRELQRFHQRCQDWATHNVGLNDPAIYGGDDATEAESTLLHLEEDRPAPRYVPDEPPQESLGPAWAPPYQEITRTACGVGWPS